MKVDQTLESFYDGRFLNQSYELNEILIDKWPKERETACVKWIPMGNSLLEIGFGNGNLLYTLSKKYRSVYGVEISENRIGPMKLAFEKKETKNVKLMTANVEKCLPFEDEKFDCVVWLDVIEHVVDFHSAMKEINRVLKPGGFIITSTPNIAELRRRIKLLFGKFPSTACEKNEGFDLSMKEPYDRGHLHYFTLSGMKLLYKIHGFKFCKSYGFGNLGKIHNIYPPLLCGTVFAVGEKRAL